MKKHEVFEGKSRFYLGDDKILYVTVVGSADRKRAKKQTEICFNFADTAKDKIDMLVDLNKGKKPSVEAIEVFRGLVTHYKFRKVALIGLSAVSRVLGSFIIGFTKKENNTIFQDKRKSYCLV